MRGMGEVHQCLILQIGGIGAEFMRDEEVLDFFELRFELLEQARFVVPLELVGSDQTGSQRHDGDEKEVGKSQTMAE
jgi:hypothetical protein